MLVVDDHNRKRNLQNQFRKHKCLFFVLQNDYASLSLHIELIFDPNIEFLT